MYRIWTGEAGGRGSKRGKACEEVRRSPVSSMEISSGAPVAWGAETVVDPKR